MNRAFATGFAMPAETGNTGLAGLSRRWHELATRRLAFYATLYRTGRWTLYFASRQKFAAHMMAVMNLEKTWARIADLPAKSADDQVQPHE